MTDEIVECSRCLANNMENVYYPCKNCSSFMCEQCLLYKFTRFCIFEDSNQPSATCRCLKKISFSNWQVTFQRYNFTFDMASKQIWEIYEKEKKRLGSNPCPIPPSSKAKTLPNTNIDDEDLKKFKTFVNCARYRWRKWKRVKSNLKRNDAKSRLLKAIIQLKKMSK